MLGVVGRTHNQGKGQQQTVACVLVHSFCVDGCMDGKQ
jgi:hypothetical protein